METVFINGDVLLKNIRNFKLCDVFDCGQCFRFNPIEDGSYIGTAFGKTIRISQSDDTVILHSVSQADFDGIWRNFLDLDRDYSAIRATLTSTDDPIIADAARYGDGIRILNQELWETIISFIISASNNIPRIKKIIESLCENFGNAHVYEGKTYYSFPTPDVIASLDEDDLSVIKAGFRTKYILACAKAVCDGSFDLELIRRLPTPDAKQMLMSLNGVGNKVSDCILLFSLGRFDSFPIDVWIKRIMEHCYFGGEEQSAKTISDFADERFGALGGIAQQYLFYYARSPRIGA